MIKAGYYLGFDFGMRCIGVAIGQTTSQNAQPLTILKAQQGVPDWKIIDKLCEEWLVKGFVIGLAEGDAVPLHFQQATKDFAQLLEQHYSLPCYFIDEHFSTAAAKEQVKGQSKKAQRHDDVAAAIILQSFFNAHCT